MTSPSSSHRRSLRAERSAVSLVFFVTGIVFANWVTRIPEVKDHIGASNATLGLVLLCIAVGSLVTMPATGRLCDHLGSSRVVTALGLALAAVVLLPGRADSPVALGGALALLGAAYGSLDVAMNVAAVSVVQRAGRPIMTSFHAWYSLGALAGAGTGLLAIHAGLSPAAHLTLVAAGSAIAVLVATPALPPDAPHAVDDGGIRVPTGPVLRSTAVWLFGLIAFCAALSEGAMSDWTGLFMRDVAGAPEERAALGYAAFSVAMVLGRMAGARVLSLGRRPVLAASFALAAGGVLLAVVTAAPLPALLGFLLTGLGLAVAFPVAMEGAGEAVAGGRGVSVVGTIGYTGFLVGPALIGQVADLVDLRWALLVVAALATVGAITGRAAPRPFVGTQVDRVPSPVLD